MKTHHRFIGIALAAAVLVMVSHSVEAAVKPRELRITRDAAGKVTVTWDGRGALKQASVFDGRFRPVHSRGRSHTTDASAGQMLYAVESAQSPIYSVNIVGYVNVPLPPGVSLVCNPLRDIENTVEALFRNHTEGTLPPGMQVYKYVSGVGYEVSVFDGVAWSNPDMDLSPGIGFFVDNPSSTTIVNTFIGEVLLGTLVNHLPEGFSLEGALLPQAGSINDVQAIPGEQDDVIRFYINDGAGGGDYITSTFSGAEGRWVPDMVLNVAQGFVSERGNAQDWIRHYSITP